MNALVKRALTLGAPALVGAGAGASGFAALQGSTRQAVTIALGDSLKPAYAIRADTVLRVVGSKIVAARCGQGMIFLRTMKGVAVVSADTVDVTVDCTPPAVASVFVCISPTDSLVKYDLLKYDSLGRSLSLDARGDSLVRSWGCIDSLTVDSIPPPAPATRVSLNAP